MPIIHKSLRELEKEQAELLLNQDDLFRQINEAKKSVRDYEDVEEKENNLKAEIQSLTDQLQEIKSLDKNNIIDKVSGKNKELLVISDYLDKNFDVKEEAKKTIKEVSKKLEVLNEQLTKVQVALNEKLASVENPTTNSSNQNKLTSVSISNEMSSPTEFKKNIETLEEFAAKKKYEHVRVSENEHEFISKEKHIRIAVNPLGVRCIIPVDKSKQDASVEAIIDFYLKSIEGKNITRHKFSAPSFTPEEILVVENKLAERLFDKGFDEVIINGTSREKPPVLSNDVPQESESRPHM